MQDFASRIVDLRYKKGFSQATLAQITGVGKSSISNYETGYCLPNSEVASLIAEALDTTIEYLFAGCEIPNLSDTVLNYSHIAKIPVYDTQSYNDIMSLGTSNAKSFMELPNFFAARNKRCLALYVTDNFMDGAKIEKGDLAIVEWVSISLSDDAEIMKKRISEEFENGQIYAFEYEGKIYFRRLFDRNGAFSAVSESVIYQNRPKRIEYGDLRLIGKCIGAVIEF